MMALEGYESFGQRRPSSWGAPSFLAVPANQPVGARGVGQSVTDPQAADGTEGVRPESHAARARSRRSLAPSLSREPGIRDNRMGPGSRRALPEHARIAE